MKILLIGNNKYLNQKSMRGYSDLLNTFLKKSKFKCELVAPKPLLSKLMPKNNFVKKYLYYFDNYIIFGIYIYFKSQNKDLIHICDHANSPLIFFLKKNKTIITCHDLININLIDKKKLTFLGNIYQKIILYHLLKAKKIICVSSSTQKELKKYTHNSNNLITIHNTFFQPYFKINKNFQKSFFLKNKIDLNYFLHVGSNNWYKNKLFLIKIFYYLKKYEIYKNTKLILVGEKKNYKINKLISFYNLKNEIINLVDIKNFDLQILYMNAKALIFPSLKEGFGLPIIEAQKNNCPVFVMNKPSMNEIGNKSVYYLNNNNAKKNAQIVFKKLKNKSKIISLGKKNINRFNFSLIKKKYLSLYKSLSKKNV